MKMSMLFRGLTLLVSLGLVVGCSSQPKKLPMKVVDENGQLADAYLSNSTVKDSLDRSSTYTQLGVDVGLKDEQGKPILKQVSGELTVGPTVAGDVARGATVGTGAAFIQRSAATRSAKIKTRAMECPDGTLACHSTILGGASANAGASSGSQSGVDFEATLQSSCPNGQCSPVSMD